MTNDVRVNISKRIDHTIEPTLYTPSSYRDPRIVTEAQVTWRWEDGEWVPSRVACVSSLPKKDGTPSARETTEVVFSYGYDEFFAAFPVAATKPAERITLTIEGGAQ